jgi:hypothetical protein
MWMHALAIGYSPAYLAENADGVRQDWPRVAGSGTRNTLEASARYCQVNFSGPEGRLYLVCAPAGKPQIWC